MCGLPKLIKTFMRSFRWMAELPHVTFFAVYARCYEQCFEQAAFCRKTFDPQPLGAFGVDHCVQQIAACFDAVAREAIAIN
ncbi:hypothetical protein AW930_13940 [Pseudomonas aeruginosa]|nr:hypothetical protein AW930_13940 [Pseudomonas aeruginosa]